MVRKLLKAEKMRGNGVPVVTWKTVYLLKIWTWEKEFLGRMLKMSAITQKELARFQVEFRETIKVLESKNNLIFISLNQ